jgi:hypothetical protein
MYYMKRLLRFALKTNERGSLYSAAFAETS